MGTHTEMREKPISESIAHRISQCMELKPTSFSGSFISPPHSLLGGEMKDPGNKDELKQREGVLQKMMDCCLKCHKAGSWNFLQESGFPPLLSSTQRLARPRVFEGPFATPSTVKTAT